MQFVMYIPANSIYQHSFFITYDIYIVFQKTSSNYVFDDSSKTTMTQSSLRNELKLNLPEVAPGGGNVLRVSCCRCCCCCCDLARAACPSRDSAPRETFFSPEMSDRHTQNCYTPCPEKKVPLIFCCNFYKY